MLSCVYRVEVWHAALLRLYNSFTPARALAMVFAKWNTRAGLSCVSTEHWWLLANLFSLFFFLHKVAYFSLQMGVWGSSEVLFFSCCTHTICGLLASQTSSQIVQSVSWATLRAIRILAWACPCLCGSATTVIWSTEHWFCGLCVFGEPAHVLQCSQGANVGTSLWTEIHASLGTRGSLVSISCSGSPLRCAMLLLPSCFLELPLA